jgi:hypothetical protein
LSARSRNDSGIVKPKRLGGFEINTALNVLASAFLWNNRQIILPRVAALGLPAIYQFPAAAEEGGFIGYGSRLDQIYRNIWARQLVKLIHLRPDDSQRVIRKLIDAQPEAVIVNNEVLSIYEAIWFHRIEKCDIIGRIAWTEMQVTKAIGSARLLSLHRERPCSRGASDQ